MSANRVPTLFITGSDTGVGKTVFGAALARLLRRRGIKVGVIKPVESGVADCSGPGADAALLAWAADCEQPTDRIAPYRLQAPVAPAVAASREQVRIVPGTIQEAFDALCRDYEFVLVEGAGGLMTPLAGGFLVADLIRQLQTPMLLVCRPGLGTINHTMLSLFSAQNLGIETAGYVINGMPAEPNLAESQAAHTLASLTAAELLAVTPHIDGLPGHDAIERLADAIEGLPTLRLLLQAIGLSGA